MLAWRSCLGVVPVGAKSQRKGRTAERELAAIFRANGIPAEPGAPESFGATPDIVGVGGIHCEVKRCQQLRLSEWMQQAVHDAEKFHDGAPAIFFRRNREQWRVVMNLTDWLEIYGARCQCGGHCNKSEISEKGGQKNNVVCEK